MENISKGPTFRDFVTILTETSMQDVTVARSREIFTAIAITRKIVQCYCFHRVVVIFTVSINKSNPCRHNNGRICIIQQLLSHLGTVKTIREYTLPSSSSIKCNVGYCVKVSLSGQSKYSLHNTKGKRVVGNLCISLIHTYATAPFSTVVKQKI
jgi:hypothetical protein